MIFKDRVRREPYKRKITFQDGRVENVKIEEADGNVVENGTTLNAVNLNKLQQINDTGWIDLTKYIQDGFAARYNMPPEIRITNNIIFFKGEVYATKNINEKTAIIMANLPFTVTAQINGSGVRWGDFVPYGIFWEANKIKVGQSSNIMQTEEYKGFQLASLSGNFYKEVIK